MGCTTSNEKQSIPSSNPSNRNQQRVHNSRERDFEPYLQSRINPSFNFPEMDNDTYIGTGIKRIKAYISKIPESELKKRRNEFWETRIEGNSDIWNFLREICENKDSDDSDIKAFLEVNDIIPYKNCINVTYDGKGFLYEIPNYCIQDPFLYDLPKEDKNKPKIENIIIFVWKEGNLIKIKESNYLNIGELKKILSENFKCSYDKIRLFFGGKEMKNDKELWYYNVTSECTIMSMVVK